MTWIACTVAQTLERNPAEMSRYSASRVLQLGIRTGGRSIQRKTCLLLCRIFLGRAFELAATAPDAVSDKDEDEGKSSSKNVRPATEHFFLVPRLLLRRGLRRVPFLGRGPVAGHTEESL